MIGFMKSPWAIFALLVLIGGGFLTVRQGIIQAERDRISAETNEKRIKDKEESADDFRDVENRSDDQLGSDIDRLLSAPNESAD